MTYPEDEGFEESGESDTPRTVYRRRAYYEWCCKQIPKEDEEKDFDGSRKYPKKRQKLTNQKLKFDEETIARNYEVWNNALQPDGRVRVPKKHTGDLRETLNYIAATLNIMQGSLKALTPGSYIITFQHFTKPPGWIPSEEDTACPIYCTVCSDLLDMRDVGHSCKECGIPCCRRCEEGPDEECWICRSEEWDKEQERRKKLDLPPLEVSLLSRRSQQLLYLDTKFPPDDLPEAPHDISDRDEYDFFPFIEPTYQDPQAQRNEHARQQIRKNEAARIREAFFERQRLQRLSQYDDQGKWVGKGLAIWNTSRLTPAGTSVPKRFAPQHPDGSRRMPGRDEATAVRKDSARLPAAREIISGEQWQVWYPKLNEDDKNEKASWVSSFGQYKWKPHEIIRIFMKVKNRHTTL